MKNIGIVVSIALSCAAVACGGPFENDDMEGEPVATESSAITYTAPVQWQQGQLSKGLGNVNNSVCFLTYVQGRFAGDGEEVGIFGVSPGAWHLGGTSQQTGVAAGARCITGISTSDYTQSQYWNQGEAPVALGRMVNGNLVQADSSWSCFLTSMRGRFDGFGEEIRTNFSNGKWWLTGGSQQVGVRAGAQCVRSPKRTTYTVTYPEAYPLMHLEIADTSRVACFLRGVTGHFDASTFAATDLAPPGPIWRLHANRASNGALRAWGACVF